MTMTRDRMPLTLPGEVFFNRPVKPLSLALTMATLVLVVINATNVGILGASVWGDVVAVLATVDVVILVMAWWARSQRFSETGLLLAGGVWGARSMLGLLVDGIAGYGAYLSFAWMVAAGGAYLLERAETNGRRHVGRRR